MSGATNNKILRLDNFTMPVCWLTSLVVMFLGQPVQLLFTMMRFFFSVRKDCYKEYCLSSVVLGIVLRLGEHRFLRWWGLGVEVPLQMIQYTGTVCCLCLSVSCVCANKGIWKVWWPELDPCDPHNGRKAPTPSSCPLWSTALECHRRHNHHQLNVKTQ